LLDDESHDLKRDAEEYGKFYKRLMGLLADNDDPDDNMIDEEAKAAMEADFNCDSVADRFVDREEFMNWLFQLADQWCEDIDTDEYVCFLQRGFDVVYKPEFGCRFLASLIFLIAC
jgi:hypothetical protein